MPRTQEIDQASDS